MLYKKSIVHYTLTFFTCLFLFSCGFNSIQGTGPIETENRTVDSFSAIELNSNFDIFITQAGETTLSIETHSNLFEHIETYVSGSTLIVDTKDDVNLDANEPIIIRISAPTFDGISINGSGAIIVEQEISGEYLDCNINGSGDIQLGIINYNKLDGNINGSGDILSFGGNLNQGSYNINGSGDIQLKDVPTQHIDININGSGDLEVYALKQLDVDIGGSGNVYYKGNPELTSSNFGSGDIERMN